MIEERIPKAADGHNEMADWADSAPSELFSDHDWGEVPDYPPEEWWRPYASEEAFIAAGAAGEPDCPNPDLDIDHGIDPFGGCFNDPDPPPEPVPPCPFDHAIDGRLGLDHTTISRWHARLATMVLPVAEADLIDLMRAVEDLKSCAAALQARAGVAFDHARRQKEADRGIGSSRRGRGIGGEIALARRESPHRGGRLLGLAKALVHELPKTLAALTTGVLNEWRATLVARESACLDPADRARVDDWLAAHLIAHPTIGDGELVADVRRKVIEIDQTAYLRRINKAVGERRVTIRPLPDGMVKVTAVLPLVQGIGCWAALNKAADQVQAAGDPERRPRSAVLADLLIERLTGRPAEAPADVVVNVVITDEALFSESDEAGHVDGYGPVPPGWVPDLVEAYPAEQVHLRRLFRSAGRLITMESTSEVFPDGLKRLIRLRDQRCRMPWCGAPIRHTDHVHARADGGATSELNGQGLCEQCNYLKAADGWTATAHRDTSGHTVTTATPTGHSYTSTQPHGPGD